MRRGQTLAVCIALAALILLAYHGLAHHDFVNYDDADYVYANQHVLSGLSVANAAWAFTTGHASNWHPLTWLSHQLDCQLFGDRPGPAHAVSLAWHLLNTILLFLFLNQVTGAFVRAALVAAFFGLHPLHVESVAWISERKDVLSAFFFLLTLICYAKHTRGRDVRRGSRWYVGTILVLALGLMSKPMLVTTPFLLLLLDYWPLGRLQLEPGWGNNLARLIWEKIPLFLLALMSSIATFYAQKHGGAVSTVLSPLARFENAAVAYGRYLGKLLWPFDLSVLYPHPGYWPLLQVLLSAILVMAVTLAAVLIGRRRPFVAVGWLWFIGMLVPVIGIVQVGIQSMADRYMYLPMIGLLIIIVWGFAEVLPWTERNKPLLVLIPAGALLGCAALTARQTSYWTNSETLFRHAVAVTSGNYLAWNNLGFYLSHQGKLEEAKEAYAKSLAINPDYEDALNNMGFALAGEHKHREAIPYYEAARRVRPDNLEVRNNLGNALSETGNLDAAIEEYNFVLARNRGHADAHNNLGIALAMKGELEEAITHFRAAIDHKPNYASAHSNLGNALAAQRKFDEAIEEYQKSLTLNPRDPQAHNNLGNVLQEKGRWNEAIGHYEEAIRLNPVNPEANLNLGLSLLKKGDVAAAKSHFQEALRLRPDYSEARRQLELLRNR